MLNPIHTSQFSRQHTFKLSNYYIVLHATTLHCSSLSLTHSLTQAYIHTSSLPPSHIPYLNTPNLYSHTPSLTHTTHSLLAPPSLTPYTKTHSLTCSITPHSLTHSLPSSAPLSSLHTPSLPHTYTHSLLLTSSTGTGTSKKSEK